jgi:tetratricopeptide (TPR) repeat protein
VEPNRIHRFVESTPEPFLAERKKWKEVQVEAWAREVEREKKKAQADPGAASAEEIDWSQTADFKKTYLKLKQRVQANPDDPSRRYEFAILLDEHGRKSAALGELERAIDLAPDRLLYANSYRTLVRRYGHLYFDRAIRFFEDLTDRHPEMIMPRLNKALAYVDKMPYPKLGIVGQGILSNRSLAELDTILERDPECWTAKFIRGMNHLHWPRKLGHAPLAIADFTELIALQQTYPPEKQSDHFALAYVCLGDSYVKNRDQGLDENLARARETWRRGLEQYPDSSELTGRLELMERSSEDLIEYVRRLRGLEDPVDTDLSRVWVED